VISRNGRLPTSLELLELDIDLRLGAEACSVADEIDPSNMPLLWASWRLAFGLGYVAALTEDQRGKLLRDHALPIPPRGWRE
jgi:hypothetical protein